MTNPSVSVIVVSYGRPRLLQLCLLAISQLQYDCFEVIVVADQSGLDALQNSGIVTQIKSAHCEVANISIARNIGLELASGEVVAFLDDDSVPEPGWLHHLASVFNNKSVQAAGGYVLGRNGISFQSKAQLINSHGFTDPLKIDGTKPVVRSGTAQQAVKTVGTNCAFRRSVFQAIGGFDHGFAYYLDESDVNLRIAAADGKTVIVPLAQVHHKTAASHIRKLNRVPHSLHQVGKSTAIFLRRHCPQDDHDVIFEQILLAQNEQLVRHMLKGRCRRRDIIRLLQSLKTGFLEGRQYDLLALPTIAPPKYGFLRFSGPAADIKHVQIAGYRLQGFDLRKMAASSAAAGSVVSLYLFSRTALYHHVQFHLDGYWLHSGGIFGRSVRSQPMFQWHSLDSRVALENNRLATVRNPWQVGAD